MKFAIHTLGTRGDVQPYIALAKELVARGNTVSLAAPVQFERLVTMHGIGYFRLPGDFLDLLDSPEAKSAIRRGQGFGAGFKLLGKVRPMMRKLLDAEAEHAHTFAPDALIYHPKSLASPHLAEWLGIPAFLASPLPGFTPTVAFPSPLLPFPSLGRFNRVSHLLATRGPNLLFRRTLRQWRAETLGVPRRERRNHRPAGTLYAYSPHVIPRPSDWGDNVCVSGYWFLDEPDFVPPDYLERFIAEGEPPVYVGFGSMPSLDAEATAIAFVNALTDRGARGLIATGGGALARVPAPPTIHFIDGAPHEWLFPRMRAIIHHGGAGTTGAALRAGKPSAICPFFGDQPFWGRIVQTLGVGSAPLDRNGLSSETIRRTLSIVDGDAIAGRATALGTLIRSESGAAAAANFIERHLAR